MLIEDDVVLEYVKRFIPLIIVISVIFALCIGVIIYSLIMEYIIKPRKKGNNENLKVADNKLINFYEKTKSRVIKRRKIVLPATLVILCAAIVIPIVAVNAVNNNESSQVVEGKELVRIDVKTAPSKTTYQVGENFDPTGMVIQATYVDKATNKRTTEEITDYTIDKTSDVLLTAEDNIVTISYQGKSTILRIVVEKPRAEFDIDITEVGDYKVEAEDLDSRTWVPQPGREGMFFENATGGIIASGDRFIGSIVDGTNFNVRFKLDKKYVVNLTGVFAKYEEDYDINAANDFYIDEQEIQAPSTKFGADPIQIYTNWKDVDFGSFVLEAGVHEFKMLVRTMGPNVDCIKIGVAEYNESEKILSKIEVKTKPNKTIYAEGEIFDEEGLEVYACYTNGLKDEITDYQIKVSNPLTVNDNEVVIKYENMEVELPITVIAKTKISGSGSYLIEAENLNKTLWAIQPGREGLEIETPSNSTSGGKSVGSLLPNSKLVIMFEAQVDVEMDLTATLAQIKEEYDLNSNTKFTLDDQILTYTPVTFGGTDEIPYTNWKDVIFDRFEIKQGLHQFTMEIIGEGCNIDCFTFEAKAAGEEVVVDSIEVTKMPTKMNYSNGEMFDPEGMEVTAHYSNGESNLVTNYIIDKTGPLSPKDNIVTITYLGKSTTIEISIDNQIKISTPDNSTDKLFYFNQGNGYIEIDRLAGYTMFNNYTEYVKVHIYDSTTADVNSSLGSFKLVDTNINDAIMNSGTVETNDGSISVPFHGGPHNYFMNGDQYSQLMDVIVASLGDKYVASQSYYLAIQIIAKSGTIDNANYSDSDISCIGGSAFTRA